MRLDVDIPVTNNPLVKEMYESKYDVAFLDTDMLGVLTHVRDMVHKGHKLLTHPLSGSVKPNETIYKTVLVSGACDSTDIQSVNIIESSISTAKKFPPKQIHEKNKNDMQLVDLSLIDFILEN